jgi:hypothetical protein
MLNEEKNGIGIFINNIEDTYIGNFINGYLTVYREFISKKTC